MFSLQEIRPSNPRKSIGTSSILLIRHSERTGEICDQEQWSKGKGYVRESNIEAGGLARVTLNRSGPLYQAVYRQRTSCERTNSQARALGIERSHARNRRSVANLNTLTYILSNLRGLQRARSLAQIHRLALLLQASVRQTGLAQTFLKRGGL